MCTRPSLTTTLLSTHAHRFSEPVRLPAGVDRDAMRATYEDGLLVVTMPRKRADGVKQLKITIGRA